MTMTGKGLAKLIEECGELVQVAGKRLAYYTIDDHPDGAGSLQDRMADEMADVTAAMVFVSQQFGIDTGRVKRRAAFKLAKFQEWHAEEGNNSHAIDAVTALAQQPAAVDGATVDLRGLIEEIDPATRPATGEKKLIADQLRATLAKLAQPQRDAYKSKYHRAVDDLSAVSEQAEALRAELEFELALVKELLPYQDRAVVAEARAERLAEALRGIADIATGSRTANSLPHIEKIARAALHPTAAQESVRFGCGYARGRCDCKKCLAAINAAAQEGKDG